MSIDAPYWGTKPRQLTVRGGGVPHEVELGAGVLVLGARRAADGLVVDQGPTWGGVWLMHGRCTGILRSTMGARAIWRTHQGAEAGGRLGAGDLAAAPVVSEGLDLGRVVRRAVRVVDDCQGEGRGGGRQSRWREEVIMCQDRTGRA